MTPGDGGGSDDSFYRVETEAREEKVAKDADFPEAVIMDVGHGAEAGVG